MSYASVDGHECETVTVYVPQRGVWYAECAMIEAPELSGRVTIALGDMRLSGTVDPAQTGTRGGQLFTRIVAGAGAWGTLLAPKAYHSDAGVQAATVAQDAAREAGETLSGAPTGSIGVRYVRRAGPASQALSDATAGAWWVDYDGVTQVGTRPALTPAADSYVVLDEQPGDRVLEIGCGWGALAEAATCELGAHITGVTLSTEQLAFAQARMSRLGVAAQADLRLQDYRDISDAPFDAICSIEMIEAVGQSYWPTYFQTVSRLLKPGGQACIQSITIDDALFDRYVKSTDFIQQYIFPGGCLPSPSEFRKQARAAGLEVVDELNFGPDYAETLRRWRDSFMAQLDQVKALKFDDRFIRLWEIGRAHV